MNASTDSPISVVINATSRPFQPLNPVTVFILLFFFCCLACIIAFLVYFHKIEALKIKMVPLPPGITAEQIHVYHVNVEMGEIGNEGELLTEEEKRKIQKYLSILNEL